MAKFINIFGKMGSEWTEEHETKEEAIQAAESEWNHLSDYDKKHCDYFYTLESENEDEDAPNHLDGDIVKVYKDSE